MFVDADQISPPRPLLHAVASPYPASSNNLHLKLAAGRGRRWQKKRPATGRTGPNSIASSAGPAHGHGAPQRGTDTYLLMQLGHHWPWNP
uniref:Uncharacterized protein n=1 Tax=Oryza nivara TaxID=4536 RepID=A0A0E0IJV4_ORYNI